MISYKIIKYEIELSKFILEEYEQIEKIFSFIVLDIIHTEKQKPVRLTLDYIQ